MEADEGTWRDVEGLQDRWERCAVKSHEDTS